MVDSRLLKKALLVRILKIDDLHKSLEFLRHFTFKGYPKDSTFGLRSGEQKGAVMRSAMRTVTTWWQCSPITFAASRSWRNRITQSEKLVWANEQLNL